MDTECQINWSQVARYWFLIEGFDCIMKFVNVNAESIHRNFSCKPALVHGADL